MLQFKEHDFAAEYPPARWSVGVDRRHAVTYVGLALIIGFVVGFLVARNAVLKGASAPALVSESQPTNPDSPADTHPGDLHKVARVMRGDAIDVEGVGPVRMIGIETPDGKTPREVYAAHGERAVSYVEKTLLGQEVRLEFDTTEGRREDDSGYTAAYVYLRDGTLINAEMVKQGLAWLRDSERFQMADDFRGFEREAMQAMRGLWGPSSSATMTSSRATTTPTPSAEDKPRKLAPLSPSALGANIPALSEAASSSQGPGVWVSRSDKMYHKPECQFLDNKKHSIPLSQARAEGYRACSRCYASTVLRAP